VTRALILSCHLPYIFHLPYPFSDTIMSSSRLSLLFIAFFLFSGASALTCFENDDEGNVYSRTNEAWKYCSLIPFAAPNGKGRASGVGAVTENLAGYDATFGQNSKLYKVLTMCIYEQYNFGAINPAFGTEPEYMFRCFCNTDGCNKMTTFHKYLSAQRDDSKQ
ncbi:hypothetical protein PENTCL1PPCAC_2113, partial [Pristionchus entomophagus]